MADVDELYTGIKRLDEAVTQGAWHRAKPWGGAGVVVDLREPDGDSEYKYVVTPHAAELSWLFAELWQVFKKHDAIDYMTKFEFFGRLANAALHYQRRAAGDEQLRDLLGAVVHEAYALADEIDEGSFTALAVAPVGVVFDDLIDRSDRDDYMTIEETRRWFAERGIE